MVCPFCLHKKTHVYNSRPTKRLNQVWRRRECLNCHKQFSSRESIDLSGILTVRKFHGKIQFSPVILLASITRSIDHLPDIDETTHYLGETIQNKLLVVASQTENIITTKQIAEQVLETLYLYDYPAYVKYAVAHNIHPKRK